MACWKILLPNFSQAIWNNQKAWYGIVKVDLTQTLLFNSKHTNACILSTGRYDKISHLQSLKTLEYLSEMSKTNKLWQIFLLKHYFMQPSTLYTRLFSVSLRTNKHLFEKAILARYCYFCMQYQLDGAWSVWMRLWWSLKKTAWKS